MLSKSIRSQYTSCVIFHMATWVTNGTFPNTSLDAFYITSPRGDFPAHHSSQSCSMFNFNAEPFFSYTLSYVKLILLKPRPKSIWFTEYVYWSEIPPSSGCRITGKICCWYVPGPPPLPQPPRGSSNHVNKDGADLWCLILFILVDSGVNKPRSGAHRCRFWG